MSECHGHRWELVLKYNLRFYSQLPKQFLQIAVAYLYWCFYWDTFREKKCMKGFVRPKGIYRV